MRPSSDAAKMPTGDAVGQRAEAALAVGQRDLGGVLVAAVDDLAEEVLRARRRAPGTAETLSDAHTSRPPGRT